LDLKTDFEVEVSVDVGGVIVSGEESIEIFELSTLEDVSEFENLEVSSSS